MPSRRFTFTTLIIVVAIAGASQGLTIPLLSILLEKMGVSAVANGFNAASLYIGILLVSPFLELALRRFGYRSTIFAGLLLVALSTAGLPLTTNFWAWFILRMLMGVGDSALHYACQMWVTRLSQAETRGRSLSIYGLAYGVGFSVGPLGILLVPLGTAAPFIAIGLFYLIAFMMLLRVKNVIPEPVLTTTGENRYKAVIRLGWLALLPSFMYGFMEASLNGSFPIYTLRIGLSADWIPIILPAFVVGSLVLQLPLGTLSDRIDRKKVMIMCAMVGAISFMLFPFVGQSPFAMMALLAVAGAAVGSFYSLGLAFSADILPENMVPTAGILSGMNFSLASIMAPSLNGYLIDDVSPGSIFVTMGILLGLFTIAGFLYRTKPNLSQQTVVS